MLTRSGTAQCSRSCSVVQYLTQTWSVISSCGVYVYIGPGNTQGEFLCNVAVSQKESNEMMRFMLLFSRQGKLRLQKWYTATAERDKKKMVRELMQIVLARKPKMCSFLEWRDLKIVYKRYASLYFCCAIEEQDNELITLEVIHRFVELLDKYFGSVCELDIIFNFEKAYFILDEFLMGGEIQDTSKKSVLKAIEQADLLQEEDESPRSVLEEMGLA
ncbi:AP-1 complex subunit sigma-1A isoform X1 [Lates calcarifer]|uniref:AP-1 complex subunit sigma-1A isoform X1 n=1 Tax=Lates calcarifer TaxID=8187 RepID=A0A4W6EHI5_LATCA|nr:AP-1 complex subunit sigma-1A isoform X1 [Lates calcarifer]